MPAGGEGQPAPANNGEAYDQKVEKIRQHLGKAGINAVLSELSYEDKSNAINEAVEKKISKGIESKLAMVPIVGSYIKPIVAAVERTRASRAVYREGNLNAAYEVLGVQGRLTEKRGENEEDFTRLRAEGAVEDMARDGVDELTSENSTALIYGEKIEKMKQEDVQNPVSDTLFAFYKEIRAAKGDPEAIEAAREAFDEMVDSWQQGDRLNKGGSVNANVRKSSVVQFLFGDTLTRKFREGDDRMPMMTNLEAIKGMKGDIEKLAELEGVDDAMQQYLSENVSLYRANMKEGTYTKKRVDNLMAAIQHAGVIGGIAFTVLGLNGRSAAKGAATNALGEKFTNMSRGAKGGIVGATFGGVLGAIRGVFQAKQKASTAEIKAATSEEELRTDDERFAKTGDEGEDGKDGENEEDIVKTKKKDTLLRKFGAWFTGSRRMGEFAEKVSDNENSGRKSAQELYDQLEISMDIYNDVSKANDTAELDDLVKLAEGKANKKGVEAYKKQIEGIKKILADANERGENPSFADAALAQIMMNVAEVEARNKVSAKNKVDLIGYSAGNIGKERKILADKMREATAFIESKSTMNEDVKYSDAVDFMIDELDLNEGVKNIIDARKTYERKNALARGIQGAMIGGIAGFAAGQLKDYLEKKNATGENGAVSGESQESEPEYGESNDVEISEDEIDPATGEMTWSVKINGKNVLGGEQDDGELGIKFDNHGEMTEESVQRLKDLGFEVQDNSFEKVLSEKHVEAKGLMEFFNDRSNEAVAHIEKRTWASRNEADISGIVANDDGSLTIQVMPARGSDVNVDDLQLLLTPNKLMQQTAIALDVDANGTVTIPANSPAMSMFEGTKFIGHLGELGRATGTAGQFNIVSTPMGGNGSVSEIRVEMPEITRLVHSYTLTRDGAEYPMGVPEHAVADLAGDPRLSDGEVVSLVAEGARDTGEPAGYNMLDEATMARDAAGNEIRIDHYERFGGYSESNDIYYGKTLENGAELLKDAGYAQGTSVVKEMQYDDYLRVTEELQQQGMSGKALETAVNSRLDRMFLEKVESGEIDKGDVVETYLRNVGSSAENIVTMRSFLGGLRYNIDVDGDGTIDFTNELVDTQEEINAVADMLARDPEAYNTFVKDTMDLFYEKMAGGSIRFVDYTQEHYQYTTWSQLVNSAQEEGWYKTILQVLSQKKDPSTCNGVGIVFLDRNGNSIYDEETVRKVWGLPEGYKLEYVADRLNCDQKTARGSWIQRTKTESETTEQKQKQQSEQTKKDENEKTEQEKTEGESTKQEDEGTKREGEKTEGEKTEGEKTEGEKTEGEKTEGEKTEGEKTEGEKTEGEKTEGEKTEGEKTEGEKTEGEKTEGEKTEGEKTEGEKTEGEKTEGEKTEGEKTEGENDGLIPKNDNGAGNDDYANPTDLPVTPDKEEISGGDMSRIVEPTEDNHVEPNVPEHSQVIDVDEGGSADGGLDAGTATGDDTTAVFGDRSGELDSNGVERVWQGDSNDTGEVVRESIANEESGPDVPDIERSDEEKADLWGF